MKKSLQLGLKREEKKKKKERRERNQGCFLAWRLSTTATQKPRESRRETLNPQRKTSLWKPLMNYKCEETRRNGGVRKKEELRREAEKEGLFIENEKSFK